MSNAAASTREWLDAVVTASRELGATTFGFDDVALLGVRESTISNMEAAYIALVGERASVQIGVSSSAEGCQQLARAMIGMTPEEEDLPPADVADAIGEIVNVLAGQVKTEMSERSITVNLGIPIFIHGTVEVTNGMDLAIADVQMGHIPVSFLVLQNHKSRK